MKKMCKYKLDLSNSSKMYSYKFSLNELSFYLFAKKKCPDCNKKMEKFVKERYVGKGNADFGSLISGGQDNYRRDIYYKCLECGKEYSLEDLMMVKFRAEWNKKK